MGIELVFEWLMQPISGSLEHSISFEHKWHARLMTLAWGVMLPAGVLIARYFKITRRQRWPSELDSPFWWFSHLVLQIVGCCIAFIALIFVIDLQWADSSDIRLTLHELFGWSIMSIALVQLLGGWLRGSKGDVRVIIDDALAEQTFSSSRKTTALAPGIGDHFLMTRRRCLFEYLHKILGYSAIVLAMLNIVIGLSITDAPRWMWLAIAAYWMLLMSIAVVLQRLGWCVDTYQAIYGPSPELPGNQRSPIGFGVKRYTAEQWPPRRQG